MNLSFTYLCTLLFVFALGTVGIAIEGQRAAGTKEFVAGLQIGSAKLSLPSKVSWNGAVGADGAVRLSLNAEIDAGTVLSDIRNLSARALDRSAQCGDTVKVLQASASLIGPATVKYDLRFHYLKRLCPGSVPIGLPADVRCSAKILVSATKALLFVDVRGAVNPPCRMDGIHQSVSDTVYSIVGLDVFKRHVIDLSTVLPPEFKGVVINVQSLSFDMPPARAKLRITGESLMTRAQLAAFIARLDATSPAR